MTARRRSTAAAQPGPEKDERPGGQTGDLARELIPSSKMPGLARELIVDAYNLKAVDPKVMKVLVDDEDGRKAVIEALAWMRSIQVDHAGVAHRAGVPELLDELPPVDLALADDEGRQGD